MTKRFIAILGNKYHRIEDNETNSVYYSEDAQSIDWLVELLNALHTENQQLKQEIKQYWKCRDKWKQETKELKKENEQLRQQLQEYKENWDSLVEKTSEISLRNVELDERIGQLKAQLREKEEDERLYADEIVKLNKEAKEVLDFKSLGGDY